MSKVSLIIWDEAPMAHRNCFEAVDRSLRDLLRFTDLTSLDKPFGGKTVVLGGDFQQILPVIPKGRREDIVESSINQSLLWDYCTVFKLTQNMRIQQNRGDKPTRDFAEWILKVGDDTMANADGNSIIEIPKDLLVPGELDPIKDIVEATYPNLLESYMDGSYLQERAILAPTNDIVQELNEYIIDLIDSPEATYLSADSICKASSNIEHQDALYPVEFLNSLKFAGIPNHELKLKIGLPIMLLRNLNQSAGLCNGTRLTITQMSRWVIEARIITGTHVGCKLFIPRIILSPSDSKWPFVLKRRQFPISVCFAMTINKSQGQSLHNVGLYLPRPVFSHGQLYVAISRVTSRSGLWILIIDDDGERSSSTKNIVYKEIFTNLV
jgi:hypothetical protein